MYHIRIKTQPGRRDDALALLREIADAAIASEPETLVFAVNTVDDEPDVITTYEVFANAAAVTEHQANPVLAAVMPQLGPLIAHADVKVGTPVFGKGVPTT